MQQITAPADAWTDCGGSGPKIVFAHANGFPPETYGRIHTDLNRSYSVASFAARALWPGSDPSSISSWRDLARDLACELDRRNVGRAIGVGHSLGSVLSVYAAATDPDRYRALVLIDPVVFTGSRALLWGVFKGLGFGNRLPLIRGARKRRDWFRDLDEVRRSWARKKVFASWDPEVLEDYIRSGFVPKGDGGVTLRYPKAWEARIFELTPASVWRELAALEIPMLFIRGESSDTFLPEAAGRVRRSLPGARVVELAGCSHFVPMERPQKVSSVITEWLRSIGV